MERNPFSDLLTIMDTRSKEVSNTSFYLGQIVSSLPNLKVSLGGLVLDKQSLRVDKTLIDRHNASITCSTGSITHNMKDLLSVGDSVVVLNTGDKFIVLSKVVSI